MEAFEDHYDTLGVPFAASMKEISKSYRRLALRYHPDKNPSSRDLFDRISKAYAVLNDPINKEKYDTVYKAKLERKVKMEAMSKERRELKEKLDRDEAAAKRRKMSSSSVGRDSMKSSGIRFMEEAMERKKAEEEARRRFVHQTFIVKVKWGKKNGIDSSLKGEEECSEIFKTFHPVRTTVKGPMALVEFDTLEAAEWMMGFPWNELGHKDMRLKRLYRVDRQRDGVSDELDVLSRMRSSQSPDSKQQYSFPLSSNGVFDEVFEARTLERMIQTQRERDTKRDQV
eukprot:TRINITY_DN12722_c0_g1_i2.p2 TRINITY_DN12722_c0_g1~~TRINITY_DN12722_c0_g1_i2.p2  ORF type:complete len:285 (-),score=85.48 TRINITY_DN12722_c0_g1_i2:1747-2601(-)